MLLAVTVSSVALVTTGCSPNSEADAAAPPTGTASPVADTAAAYLDALATGDMEAAAALIDVEPDGAGLLTDAAEHITDVAAGQEVDASWAETDLVDGDSAAVPVSYALGGEDLNGVLEVTREGDDYLVLASPENSAPPFATFTTEDGQASTALYPGLYEPGALARESTLLETGSETVVAMLGGAGTYSLNLSAEGEEAAAALLADGELKTVAQGVLDRCEDDGSEVWVGIDGVAYTCATTGKNWSFEVADGGSAPFFAVVDGVPGVQSETYYAWSAGDPTRYSDEDGFGVVKAFFAVDGDAYVLVPESAEVWPDSWNAM
ncbi:hypothetical protein GCM10022202_26530 [Microbacterium marinilacus]|uniref:Uncharacterized protein n=4 Tax=Microbacterium marinilacus TaxID=415209 RepID=A0ABP7BKM7_9MICO